MKICKVRDVKTPTRAHETDAGVDFYIPNEYKGLTCSPDGTTWIHPGCSVCIPSGIKVIIPQGFAGIFMNKSSVGQAGLLVGASVVDSDYRGEVHLDLHNVSEYAICIKPGQKITQMLILPVSHCEIEEMSQLDYDMSQTERGDGGFGSTGKD